MQPPRFWYRPAGPVAKILSPLGALYAAATALRLRSGPRETLAIPSICVGNINAGGTGKTPTVIALVKRLQAKGLTPHVISRGYGGKMNGPVQVDPSEHDASDVGDEPLLMAAFTRVWVSKDRLSGAKAAQSAGAEVLIFDDGFQNPSVTYDLSIIVVDALRGFGNGKVIPAGPLREPVNTGLARADLLLSIGEPPAQVHFAKTSGSFLRLPHARGHLEPLQTGMDWRGSNVLAFAGIGHPEKFFATVKGLGANIVKAEPLEDHQPLTPALMKRMSLEAQALNAQLVTTEKDAVRLPDEFRREVLTIPVRLVIEDWTALDQKLEEMLRAPRR